MSDLSLLIAVGRRLGPEWQSLAKTGLAISHCPARSTPKPDVKFL
jgi:hypothetical protein